MNPFTFVNTYPNATGGSSGQTFLSHNPSVGDVANAVLAGGGSVDVGSGGAAGGMNPKHNVSFSFLMLPRTIIFNVPC